MTGKLTARQQEAQRVIISPAKHAMLFGGSRSGKTFLNVRNIVARAIKAPHSRHLIARFRFNALKASIIHDTLPAVMRTMFPSVPYKVDKVDWFASFPNGSQIWFLGLDDAQRAEKILGMEFVTEYFVECSELSRHSVMLALTRLAQEVEQEIDGRRKVMKPRVFYCMNPPSKAHWTYKLFVQKADPETGEALRNPDDYVSVKLNPKDNAENIAADYIETLENMPARYRKRFLDGDFADATAGALFSDEVIEKWRHHGDTVLPDFVRVVVAVDPSGSGDANNADNDAIGIVVGALGVDGNAYLLEDCTVKAGPATWGKVATDAFERHNGDVIVGEVNYGGAMVGHVIQSARPRTPYKTVTATRGKVARAEPFSALYEQGKVRHVGRFTALETELTAFTTNGYVGGDSPNRADAWIWALAELFPAIVAGPKKETGPVAIPSMQSAFRR